MNIKTSISSKTIRILSVLTIAPLLALIAVTMTIPESTKAGWAGDSFSLAVDVSTGGGTVKIDLIEPWSLPYTKNYSQGTVVTLEAIPSFGYTFKSWEKHLTSTENPVSVVIDCNKYITASFKVDWRLIGTSFGSLVLIIFLIVVLILRRRSSAKGTA